MMQGTIKKLTLFVGIVFIIILSIPLSVLLLINYQPHTLLSLVPKLTPYTITAEEFDLHPTELRLLGKNIQVSNQQGDVVANIDDVYFSTSWSSLFPVHKRTLFGSVNNAIVNIGSLSHSTEKENSLDTAKKDESNSTSPNVDIHNILATMDISLRNIEINVNEKTRIHIQQLNRLSELTPEQQGIEFVINYQESDRLLTLEGQLVSAIDQNTPTLHLNIPDVDLQSLLAPEKNHQPDSAKATLDKGKKEALLDWTALQAWAPMNINLQSDRITIPQGSIEQLNTELMLSIVDGNITIQQQHRANLNLSISETLAINESAHWNSNWQLLEKKTQGADFTGNTRISLGKNTVALDGQFNINGLIENHFSIATNIQQFPLQTTASSTQSLQQKMMPLFPFTSKFTVHNKEKQLALRDMQVAINQSDQQSDVNGNIFINYENSITNINNIQFDLLSSQLVIPEYLSKRDNKNVQKETKTDQPDTLFNTNTINTAWLDTISANGVWSINRLINKQQTVFESATTELSLVDQSLLLTGAIEKIAEGSVAFRIHASHPQGKLTTKMNASAKNVVLELLHLIPKEELSGTTVSADINLSATGNSTQTLAETVNGDILFEGGNGLIANNTFEIIGSDLLLKLVNSINPFYKQSENTELECVVIRSKVTNGTLLFNDSIAIQTSKMVIIGDGEIDLAKNSLDIGINPKARSGLGVDLASLAKFVAIQGSLTDPKIGVSGKGTLKSALTIGAAVSTGGLSLLANNLADKVISDDPCSVARKAFSSQ